MGGKATAKPPFDVLTAAAGKMRYLLLAVGTTIDAIGNLAYLLRDQSVYTNFDISSFSLISCNAIGELLDDER